jgi:hypothetical protein
MRAFVTGLCLIVLATCWGCGGSEPKEVVIPQTYNNMKTLASAYVVHTLTNGKPPSKLLDLRTFVAAEIDLDTIARSENDSDYFVIVWDLDFRTVPSKNGMQPIMMYERKGKDGFRYVCQFNDVLEMDEQQFKAAYFPPGHVPETN